MIMGIKQATLLAALLSMTAGGGISAMAKTKTVGKMTQVRLTKHTLSGKTTKYAKIRLVNAQGKQLASSKTNRVGKFKITLKNQNLSKLKFKLTASKAGYLSRRFSSTQIQQAVANATQTSTLPGATVTPAKPVKPTNPTKPTTPSRPGNAGGSGRPSADTGANLAKLIQAKRAELAAAKAKVARIKAELKPTQDYIDSCHVFIMDHIAIREQAKKDLATAEANHDQAGIDAANQQIKDANHAIIAKQDERAELYKLLVPLDNARTKASSLVDELASLDKTYVPEEIV